MHQTVNDYRKQPDTVLVFIEEKEYTLCIHPYLLIEYLDADYRILLSRVCL